MLYQFISCAYSHWFEPHFSCCNHLFLSHFNVNQPCGKSETIHFTPIFRSSQTWFMGISMGPFGDKSQGFLHHFLETNPLIIMIFTDETSICWWLNYQFCWLKHHFYHFLLVESPFLLADLHFPLETSQSPRRFAKAGRLQLEFRGWGATWVVKSSNNGGLVRWKIFNEVNECQWRIWCHRGYPQIWSFIIMFPIKTVISGYILYTVWRIGHEWVTKEQSTKLKSEFGIHNFKRIKENIKITSP